MYKIKLQIPNEFRAYNDKQLPIVQKISKWLEQINYVNNLKSQKDILNTLKIINHTQFSVSERMQVMDLFEPVSQAILSELTNKQKTLSLPLSKKQLELTHFIQLFLFEIAIGYKIIIQNISDDNGLMTKHMGSLLPKACYKSVTTLSDLLIERYQQYLSEPGKIWFDLNQIYLLTERLGISDLTTDENQTTLNAYLKISVLRISDPYRLMHSEIKSLNKLMNTWVEYTSIESLKDKDLTISHVVDLSKDCPPGTIYSVLKNIPKEARVIDVNELKIHIEQRLKEKSSEKEKGIGLLNSRLEYDMLVRLKKQFSYLEETRKDRHVANNEIKLFAGLSACHYFISGKKLFSPESEIKKAKNSNDKNIDEPVSELSILSFEEHELLDSSNRIGQLKNINPFMSEDMLVDDNWEKINSTALANANMNKNSNIHHKLYNEEDWKQKNEHDEGMLLSCDTQSKHSLNVGMLIGYYKEGNNVQQPNYSLGMIRWLKLHLKNGMLIGVMKLSGHYTSVAVKAISGVGKGGSYNQALFNQNYHCNELLLPAGIFDIGTVLNVWDQEDIFSVKITKKIINTKTVMLVKYESHTS
ncbi:MAG: hypothetical protein OQL19_16635 [Gammaproteobacteria bacterium]|nr:hypothetical protein [Gammaproteobacteria bacterium]